ncbi:MAG: cytochrome c oxidase assembly protein, partial [Solirubrobacterales bacterium]|nr:cytochrome c oxidase assembly protein [Solirubrobacterales bacterium]
MSAPSLPQLLVAHWQLSWVLDVELLLCAAVYVWAAINIRGHWPLGRTASFLAGLVALAVALESGLGTFDQRLLSAHMEQHMILLLIAPLLLLGGRPMILALRILHGQPRTRLAGALNRLGGLISPPLCIALFSAVVLLSHTPAFYEATLRHPALHELEHGAYLMAGLLLWWPVLDVDPTPSRRLGGLGRLIYLLAAMPAMAVLGAYLNRDATLLYPSYGLAAHQLGISALSDQQQAGAIMWVVGSTIIVVVGLWSVIAALVREERRQQALEAHGRVL